MLFRGLAISVLLSTLVQAQQHNATYNVIAVPPAADMSVAVVVDNQSYALVATNNSNSILYQGQAPVAQNGYHYAILDNQQQVNVSEAFARPPVQNQTYNEFFNRTTNIYNVSSLPQVLPPITALNRTNTTLHIDSQIPTIHLWGNETLIDYMNNNQVNDSIEIELNMTYYGLNNVQSFDNVKVSVAGRSSRYVPKLSYDVKIKKKAQDTLFGYKKFKLRAMSYDPSYIRERVAFATLKSVGVPCTEYSYARVYFNNKPAGFYGFIETFQDPWLANEFAGGDKDYKSGYLYQGQTLSMTQNELYFSDLSYSGDNLTIYSLGQYKIKAGTKKDANPDDFKELMEFTKFVNQTTNQTSVADWQSKLEVDGFTRAMAIENLLGFSDAYMTLADNFYVYSEPNTKRMIYIPADLDTTIGSSLFTKDYMLSGNYSMHPGFNMRPLTKQLFANPALLNSYQELLRNLSQTLVNPTVMSPFIDSVVDMIRSDVEWDKTLTHLGQPMEFTFGGVSLTDVVNNPAFSSFIPPGIEFNGTLTKASDETFDVAVNGPILNSTTQASVKGFITQKSHNIIAFYNTTSTTNSTL